MKSHSVTALLYALLLSGKYAAAIPQLLPGITITIGIPITTTKISTITTTATATIPPITTTQVTTSQVTVTAPCTTASPTGCGNQGLAYVLQSHTFTNNPAPAYTSFAVDYFKTAAPIQQGVLTNGIGFLNRADNPSIPIYDGPPRGTAFVALNHRGYFVPTTTGTYTITCTNYDDILLLWVGPNAFDASYTRANANMELGFSQSGTTATYPVSLDAGIHVPMRFLVANAQGVGWRGFTCTIQNPAGNTIVDLTTGTGANFVQFSCDGTVGAFKPLGRELP